MAHMIENNMMAWKEIAPWHGLGTQVDADATGDDMLIAAGMNWNVQRRKLAMRPVIDGRVDQTRMLVEPLDGFRAIVRSDNDQVFGVMSDRYQIVQNAEIVNMFREYCDAGHARMETVGALKGGAVVWALARLNGGSTTTIGSNDELRGYMLMTTSHDGSVRTIGKATQVRVVCHNTLTAALGDGKHAFALKHSAKWTPERKQEAQEAMGLALENVQKLNKAAATLSAITVDESAWLDFMSKLLGGDANVISPKNGELTTMAADIKEATIFSPGANLDSARGTLWGAVNGVTYYADHMRGRTQDARLMSAWFGNSESLKNTALNTALQMAGV